MQARVEGHGVPSVFPEFFVTESQILYLPNQASFFADSSTLEFKPMSEQLVCDYRAVFPKSHKILPYVQVNPTHYGLYSILNTLNMLASFLYLTAAIGLFANAVVLSTDPSLRDTTPSVVRARTFTDILGYFTAPFIITLVSAVISQIIAVRNRRERIAFQNNVLAEYKKMKKEFVFCHRKIGTFFFICEMIEKINIQLCFEGRGYNLRRNFTTLSPIQLNLVEFENQLISRLTELGCAAYYFRSPNNFDLIHIRTKLVNVLLQQNFFGKQNIFYSILAEIRKQIFFIAQELDLPAYGYAWFRKLELSFTYDAARSIPNSEQERIYSKNETLVYLIGEIAHERRKSCETMLLKTIDILGTGSDSVREALGKYWSVQKSSRGFAYPFDADLKTLARYVYSKIKTQFSDIIFD